jgi:proline iminopeptidase
VIIQADDGVNLWVDAEGHGPGMVLAHGGPGLWDYLDEPAGSLQSSARIARYDQRGGGRSGHVGPYTIKRFVSDYEAVRSAARFDRVVAAGHSWGASLALLYAVEHPDRVRGVLYMCGVGLEWPRFKEAHAEEALRRMGNGASRFYELVAKDDLTLEEEHEANWLRWRVDFADADIGRPHIERMLAAGFRVNWECSHALSAELDALSMDQWRLSLGRVNMPVLVIAGDQDPRPHVAVDSLVANLSHGSKILLEGAGHFPWAEKQTALNDAVTDWLRELPD